MKVAQVDQKISPEKEENLEIIRRYRRLLRKAKPVLKSGDTKIIRSAFQLALDAHSGVRRKSGEPYIYHPLEVAEIVVTEIGLGTTSIVSALLHDVVEDTEITLAEIEADYGKKVAQIIDGLTKIKGTFEYPLSERSPPGFKDADPETETMSLQVDDVWRIVEMTVMLGVITPLTVRWLSRAWHIGMPLHRTVMVLYFVDIVRRHSHPHSWILNTPVFVLWIMDKVWGLYWGRSNEPKVHRLRLTCVDDAVLGSVSWHAL